MTHAIKNLSRKWGLILTRAITSVVVGTLLLLAPASPSQAEKPPSPPPGPHKTFSPQGVAYGHTYGEWAAAWWEWAMSIPASTNPLKDQTGEFAAVGQSVSGPVWFLAGTLGGSAERTVTIPAGRALFFPIVNTSWTNLPALGDNPWSPAQDLFARGYVGALLDTATDLVCEIDGKPLKNLGDYRTKTSPFMVFMVELPTDDLFGYVNMGASPGTNGPCVDDGYYVMLEPLKPGTHSIHFGGSVTSTSFSVDVIYHLTIE